MTEDTPKPRNIFKLIIRAILRSRCAILTVAALYFVSVVFGIVMVDAKIPFAVSYRDNLVSGARSSPTLVALDKNDHLKAALLDFGGNLLGGSANALAGLGVVFPYPLIAYRGWVGGIVSIDSSHISRLAIPGEDVYYLITLILQLIPYTLSAGAGVNVGLALWKPKPWYQGQKWLGIPREAILDMFRIYILVIPLFLLASLWEFFLR